MTTEALSSLYANIAAVMRRAREDGYDGLAAAKQRYPDAHSSAFIEAQLLIYKSEKAAFNASVERAADQTIEGDCVDVTPTPTLPAIPAPGCAEPEQSATCGKAIRPSTLRVEKRIISVRVSDIIVGPRLRQLNENIVVELMRSIQTVGLLSPITVQPMTGVTMIRSGLHRLQAVKRLGWSLIQAREVDCDAEIDGQLVEITENLHRAELTIMERSEHIARWLELIEAKRKLDAEEEDGQCLDEEDVQVGHPPAAQPHDKGIAKAARKLRLTRQKIQRAVKIASITPEAKAAAKAAGIDDNQSKLLKVAAAPTEKQVELIENLTAARPAPEDDGLDVPPMLLRDPDAKAKAAQAALEQAILAIGALAVAEMVVARLAPHERLSLAPPAPALQPEVEATKTVIDWVFEIKHSVNRAVASSLSKRDLDVLFGHLGQHIANWERKVAERDQGMLRAESSGAA